MKEEVLHQLIECARLLGQTQAKKGFGIYTQQDSRFEVAMYKSINEHEAKIKEALAQSEQEPVALKWQRAPIRTAWGDEMVVASVAIDKDHTVCLYCERDQTPKVDAMFAQRTEQNFCPRCGKRTKDIHTCTPPRENT